MNRLKSPPKPALVQILVRQWLEQYQYCIKVRDYGQAEQMFDRNVIAFDTTESFTFGTKELRKAWERQWPTCDRFEFDLEGTKALVGKPYVTIITVWQGAFGNGSAIKGRATMVFYGAPGLVITKADPKVDRLMCVHVHMSKE